METDLHRIIYSKQPLSLDHIQYFIYQVHTLLIHVLATQHNTTRSFGALRSHPAPLCLTCV
jgi:hypothetical protein